VPEAGALYAWEFIGSVYPVHFLEAYSLVVPTTGDSIAGSNPLTAFMVVGRGFGPSSMYWLSAPDSGYSVDNLIPGAPSPFTGIYAGDGTHLAWGPNGEADLAGYRLYRGTSPAFVPGPAHLISSQLGTGYSDVGVVGGHYKLSAIDAHGNESPFALASPTGTTDVDAPRPGVLALSSPWPSPARDRAALRLALPDAQGVTLGLYGVDGRQVRALPVPRAAGEHTVAFELHDAAGRPLPTGMYFVRLTAPAQTLVRRLLVVR
jgi:hypothetical protein